MLCRVSTSRASLGSIGRWSEEHLHTSKLCLIDYKPSQLAESPLVEPAVLGFPTLGPFPYPLKGLKDDSSSSSKSLVNDSSAYQMVYAPFEPPLLTGEFLELPLGGPSAFLLKLGSKLFVLLSRLLYAFSGKAFAVGGVGEVVDTKVNAEEALGVFRRWFLDFYRKVEKVVLSSLNEEGFTNLLGSVFKPSSLVFSKRKGNLLTSFEGGNRGKLGPDKPETSSRTKREKGSFESVDVVSLGFIREGNPVFDGYCKLSRKAEFLPYVPVHKMVESNPVEALSCPSYVRDVISCLKTFLEGVVEYLLLFLGRIKLTLEGYLHRYLPRGNIQNSYTKVKRKGGGRHIPPPALAGGLLRRFL